MTTKTKPKGKVDQISTGLGLFLAALTILEKNGVKLNSAVKKAKTVTSLTHAVLDAASNGSETSDIDIDQTIQISNSTWRRVVGLSDELVVSDSTADPS